MSKYLSISLIIVSLILGIGIGYMLSPQYSMVNTQMAMDLGKADRYIDLRYLNAMASHHQGAIELAKQVREQTKRTEIRELADAIIAGEPKLIATLQDWKQAWYGDRSEVVQPEVVNLGSYDEKLDLRFLNALIAHHQAGIEMAKEIQLKSSRNEVLNDAQAVQQFLTNSTKTLEQWRTTWYQL
jgi:uncharacterized protein (DUF305 family)